MIALIYGIFFVKEPPLKVDEKKKLKAAEKSLLVDFFDKEHVVETFRVAFKRGQNQRRLRVSMLLIVVCVVIGPLHGEMSVIYLFTRYKFNWSEVEFSFFSTYAMLTSLVGMLVYECFSNFIDKPSQNVFVINRNFILCWCILTFTSN